MMAAVLARLLEGGLLPAERLDLGAFNIPPATGTVFAPPRLDAPTLAETFWGKPVFELSVGSARALGITASSPTESYGSLSIELYAPWGRGFEEIEALGQVYAARFHRLPLAGGATFRDAMSTPVGRSAEEPAWYEFDVYIPFRQEARP